MKLVISFTCQLLRPGLTRVTTQTRVHCLDADALRSFTSYWYLIRPVSGLIRRRMLKAIARRCAAGPFKFFIAIQICCHQETLKIEPLTEADLCVMSCDAHLDSSPTSYAKCTGQWGLAISRLETLGQGQRGGLRRNSPPRCRMRYGKTRSTNGKSPVTRRGFASSARRQKAWNDERRAGHLG